MRRGRWVEPPKGTPPAKDDPAAFTVTSIKARRVEIAEFHALCVELAVKPDRAHRATIRRAAGYLEAGEEGIETLRALQREIRGIATKDRTDATGVGRARERRTPNPHDEPMHSARRGPWGKTSRAEVSSGQ